MHKFKLKIMIKKLFLASLLGLLFSCSDEHINNPDYNSTKVLSYNIKKSEVTLLSFQNIEAYESKLAELDSLRKIKLEEFTKLYNDLSEEDYNNKIEELGFIEDSPYIEFEHKMNFHHSMRKEFTTEEEKILEEDNIDNIDKLNEAYPFSVAQMTLLNYKGEVIIGKSIFKFSKDGYIEIRDGDLTKLIKINNGDLTIFSDTNVIVTYKEATENIPTVECYRWKSKEESFYFNNNSEKVIYKVRFHSYPWKGTGFAEINNYKKTGKKWEKRAKRMSVNLQIQFSDKDCYVVTRGFDSDSEYSKNVDVYFSSWGSFPQYRANKDTGIRASFFFGSFSKLLSL